MKYPEIVALSASNGRQGLESFTRNYPRLVITDINMPDMDGIQMSGNIKSIDPTAKIIVVTAQPLNVIQEIFAKSKISICNYIKKPIDYVSLFAAIDQCAAEVVV